MSGKKENDGDASLNTESESYASRIQNITPTSYSCYPTIYEENEEETDTDLESAKGMSREISVDSMLSIQSDSTHEEGDESTQVKPKRSYFDIASLSAMAESESEMDESPPKFSSWCQTSLGRKLEKELLRESFKSDSDHDILDDPMETDQSFYEIESELLGRSGILASGNSNEQFDLELIEESFDKVESIKNNSFDDPDSYDAPNIDLQVFSELRESANRLMMAQNQTGTRFFDKTTIDIEFSDHDTCIEKDRLSINKLDRPLNELSSSNENTNTSTSPHATDLTNHETTTTIVGENSDPLDIITTIPGLKSENASNGIKVVVSGTSSSVHETVATSSSKKLVTEEMIITYVTSSSNSIVHNITMYSDEGEPVHDMVITEPGKTKTIFETIYVGANETAVIQECIEAIECVNGKNLSSPRSHKHKVQKSPQIERIKNSFTNQSSGTGESTDSGITSVSNTPVKAQAYDYSKDEDDDSESLLLQCETLTDTCKNKINSTVISLKPKGNVNKSQNLVLTTSNNSNNMLNKINEVKSRFPQNISKHESKVFTLSGKNDQIKNVRDVNSNSNAISSQISLLEAKLNSPCAKTGICIDNYDDAALSSTEDNVSNEISCLDLEDNLSDLEDTLESLNLDDIPISSGNLQQQSSSHENICSKSQVMICKENKINSPNKTNQTSLDKLHEPKPLTTNNLYNKFSSTVFSHETGDNGQTIETSYLVGSSPAINSVKYQDTDNGNQVDNNIFNNSTTQHQYVDLVNKELLENLNQTEFEGIRSESQSTLTGSINNSINNNSSTSESIINSSNNNIFEILSQSDDDLDVQSLNLENNNNFFSHTNSYSSDENNN